MDNFFVRYRVPSKGTGLCLASTATQKTLTSQLLWLQRPTHPSPRDSGASDKRPVLAQHAEKGTFSSTENVLPGPRVLCQNTIRSVGKYRVGEPSLFLRRKVPKPTEIYSSTRGEKRKCPTRHPAKQGLGIPSARLSRGGPPASDSVKYF
jgi:hypothetical protein